MAITRSWHSEAAGGRPDKPPVPKQRRRELVWLAAASLLVSGALWLVLAAKTRDVAAAQSDVERGQILHLAPPVRPQDIVPLLGAVRDPVERAKAAEAIAGEVEHRRSLPNVGALAKTGIPLARVKPLFIVRTAADFYRVAALWLPVYFAAFWAVHLLWRWRRFTGDPIFLPILHLLTGFGLTLSLSLRDPLRDTLEFAKFSWGVALGCALLALPVLRGFDYRRWSRRVYTPLLAAFALLLLLFWFGSGPTGNSSKVNLGPVQPIEAIKILLVLFMAGYFAAKWEWLRELRERRLPRWLRWLDLPRFAQALPVLCAVAFALALLFLLKDLGPALVVGFLLLAMYAVARGRAALAVLGIAAVIGGVAIGYRLGTPSTVVGRVGMWLSPWNNDVRGGDQLAHGLWALATGGPFGSGPGLGDPALIPAGHTDLVLPAIGEEWGFLGVALIALLFAVLCARFVRAGLRAPDEYGLFLGVGFGTLIAIEMLLITGGVLGAVPLSGVVSPFLSSGNTAMLANFFIVAVVAGISARGMWGGLQPARDFSPAPAAIPAEPVSTRFRTPVRWLSISLAVAACALLAKAAYVQVIRDDEMLAWEAHVFQEDGVKRARRNPRLNSLARELPRGTIYDRNGVVIAEGNRRYPFGAATAHLLGDFRTGDNFHASNTSLIERDYNSVLRGFAGWNELASLVRHRHDPDHPGMKALRARDRSLYVTIDSRLQAKAAEILARRLKPGGKGALVVLEARSGDVLALASAPAPREGHEPAPDELLDRARYGQYPPGSTFKLVTAIAALRRDPESGSKRFRCAPLRGGRVGARIPGWNRPVRDDAGDPAHGSPDLARALTVSCNAYFAQLGVFCAGSKALAETAQLLELPVDENDELSKMLPFAAMGQGPVVMSPFKMARVVAAIASGGNMPQGRWVMGAPNTRTEPPKPVLGPREAGLLAAAMRSVVTSGTARRAFAGLDVSVAGKTGTAQVESGEPHSWFTGFAPYDGPVAARRLAFAVVVEHGGYGAQAAAPVAREIVQAAKELGLVTGETEVSRGDHGLGGEAGPGGVRVSVRSDGRSAGVSRVSRNTAGAARRGEGKKSPRLRQAGVSVQSRVRPSARGERPAGGNVIKRVFRRILRAGTPERADSRALPFP